MSKRILVVDDDQNIRHVLKAIFSRLGHSVAEVGNGLEATQAIKGQTFDLITMDMAMAPIDGIDAISILQSETEAQIVVISAHLTDEINRDLDARGVSVRIKKPFTIDQIIDMASHALG